MQKFTICKIYRIFVDLLIMSAVAGAKPSIKKYYFIDYNNYLCCTDITQELLRMDYWNGEDVMSIYVLRG